MSLEIVRAALLWCTIINFGVLLLSTLLFLLPHEWVYRLWRLLFHHSSAQFDGIVFTGLMFYKIGIIFFNLVPYIALCIVSRS